MEELKPILRRLKSIENKQDLFDKRRLSRTQEVKERISKSCKEGGVGKWMVGRHPSVETLLKRIKSLTGRKNKKRWSEEARKRQSEHLIKLGICPPSALGKKRTAEFRKRVSNKLKGKQSYLWKGGITPINLAIRHSFEYEEWRKSVFERDNYTCQECGQIGGYLEADHIKPFSLYLDLRFELSNGRTLCKFCHLKIGWRGSTQQHGHRSI